MTTGLQCTWRHSVLWRCWLGNRKGIRPVKTEWWGTGVVICMEQGANDLHMASWCHCHPIISCFSKIQNGLAFSYRLSQVVQEKRLLKGRSSRWGQVRYTLHKLQMIQLKVNKFTEKIISTCKFLVYYYEYEFSFHFPWLVSLTSGERKKRKGRVFI